MITLIWVYIALYVVVSVVLVVAEAVALPEEKDPLWETAADYILLALGLVGMLLYQRGIETTGVRVAWMAVAPVLVLAHVVLNVHGRKRFLAEDAHTSNGAVRATDLATMAFLVPSLAINLLYAYG